MPKETSLLAGAFGFRVSSEKMYHADNELRLEALRHFRTQTEVLSQGVAARSFRIIRIQASGNSQSHFVRQPMMAEMSIAKLQRQ